MIKYLKTILSIYNARVIEIDLEDKEQVKALLGRII